MTIVMKFGGTSMADARTIQHNAELIRGAARDHRVVTTVSAMSGVTDTLLELAGAAAAGNRTEIHTLLAKLRERHTTAAAALNTVPQIEALLDKLDTLIGGIAAIGELTMRSRDAVLSYGEQLSSTLMAAALGGVALTGGEVGIITDEHFGEAEPLMDLSLMQVRETLAPLLDRGQSVVVTGFLAATQHGVTTTLGRGGSDYTATILGAALHADEIWIWSDVDGLLTADPRIVPDAHLLSEITFAEAIEMGQFGAKSMHPRALEPAALHKVPVRMRNTFNPENTGTLIFDGAPRGGTVRSVQMLKGSALINVTGPAMIGRPGTAAALFDALAEARVNVQVISQSVSEAGISLVITGSQLDRARAVLETKLLRTHLAGGIDVQPDVAAIAAIGAGMAGVPGVAARVFTAVAEAGVNIAAIAQGSSELSICFVVDAADGPKAVAVLHNAFELA